MTNENFGWFVAFDADWDELFASQDEERDPVPAVVLDTIGSAGPYSTRDEANEAIHRYLQANPNYVLFWDLDADCYCIQNRAAHNGPDLWSNEQFVAESTNCDALTALQRALEASDEADLRAVNARATVRDLQERIHTID